MSGGSGEGEEIRAAGWIDTQLARAGFGVAVVALWLLLVFFVGNLGVFPRLPESESQSGIPWLIVGTLGFTAFSAAVVTRDRSGKALVPVWSLALPWLMSFALTILFVALNDEGARVSFLNGAPEGTFYWPQLEEWTSYLSFLVTLAVGVLVVIDRLRPAGQVTRWLVIAMGVLPYPVLGALILPEL